MIPSVLHHHVKKSVNGVVLNDLKRHDRNLCLGVVYVASTGNSSNRDKLNLIIDELQKVFPCVYPSNPRHALLRRFTGDGYVDLYAFVVSLLEDASFALRT